MEKEPLQTVVWTEQKWWKLIPDTSYTGRMPTHLFLLPTNKVKMPQKLKPKEIDRRRSNNIENSDPQQCSFLLDLKGNKSSSTDAFSILNFQISSFSSFQLIYFGF